MSILPFPMSILIQFHGTLIIDVAAFVTKNYFMERKKDTPKNFPLRKPEDNFLNNYYGLILLGLKRHAEV